MSAPDTIAAFATAPGAAAVAIVRISGPDALPVANRVFEGASPPPSSRKGGTFAHGVIRDVAGRKVDDVLMLVMRAPHSYTGEDVVEIHGHGGAVAPVRVLQTVLDAGCRPAMPGEFTRRAFLNGKMDLLQAEGVCDLIRAETDRAAQAAVEQLEGALSGKIEEISEALYGVAVLLEASLDFPDDELPPVSLGEAAVSLEKAAGLIDNLLSGWKQARLVREGAVVILAGRPNVGKSTLFNALLGKDRAIVTPYAGTTRDIIDADFILDGIRIRLVDTAGLRVTECPIEREGVARTRSHVPRADLMLHVLDASSDPDTEDRTMWDGSQENKILIVLNKKDLGTECIHRIPKGVPYLLTQMDKQDGLTEVRREIARLLGMSPPGGGDSSLVISERHRGILAEASAHVIEAKALCASGQEDYIVPAASRLRTALNSLGELTGKVYQDALLDGIFGRFCIGK